MKEKEKGLDPRVRKDASPPVILDIFNRESRVFAVLNEGKRNDPGSSRTQG